jgi:hypothetical protein
LSDTEDEDSGDGSELKGKRQRNVVDHGDKTSNLSDIDETITLSSPTDSGSPSMVIDSRDEDVEMTDPIAATAQGTRMSDKIPALSSPSESDAEASPNNSPRSIILHVVPDVEVTTPADGPSSAPTIKVPEVVPKAGVSIPVPDLSLASSKEPESAVTQSPEKIVVKKSEVEEDDPSVNEIPKGATS